MSDSAAADSAPVERGALPSLDGRADDQVLGVPEAARKSRTNVAKLAALVLLLLAMAFVILGILWFAKHRAARPRTAEKPGAGRVAMTQKNQAPESTSVERLKADIRDRQAQEDAARREADRLARAPQPLALAPAAPVSTAAAAQPPEPRPAPAPPSPEERRMSGDVLLPLAGLRPGEGPPGMARAAPAAPPGNRGHGEGGSGIAAHLRPTALEGREAGMLPPLDFLLKRGSSIPCALQTGIDTTLPGFVICKTLADVYSANGSTLLIERGATVFGEQQSALKQGQARTFVLWTRIDTPAGVYADLDSPATGPMGHNGIEGDVDTHFWQRFGGAIMLSLIKDFSGAAAGRQQPLGQANTGPTYNNATQAASDMASEALRNSINIPPTLRVLPATVVHVMVARDVSFEGVYALRR